MHMLSKTSLRLSHILSRQPYGRNVLCVEQELWYCNLGSHHMLQIESSSFVMMILQSTASLPNGDSPSEMY
jgi:hypothetical protein